MSGNSVIVAMVCSNVDTMQSADWVTKENGNGMD